MNSVDYQTVYNQVIPAIEKHGFVVKTETIEFGNNTGEFDGINIWVKEDQPIEQKLYVLLHLFGHCIQWNVSEDLRKIGMNVELSRTEEELKQVFEYERQASALMLTLLHSIHVYNLDQWVSNWFHADWMWLKHLYQHKERVGYLTYWKDDADMLIPEPIPVFTPRLFESRNSF